MITDHVLSCKELQSSYVLNFVKYDNRPCVYKQKSGDMQKHLFFLILFTIAAGVRLD